MGSRQPCRCGPAVRVDLAWIAEIQASGARLTVDDRIRDQSARFDVACRASATRDQASATDPIMTQNYAAHLDSLAAHRAVLVGDQAAHVVDGCFDRLLISMPSCMNSRCHWWKLRTSRGGFYAHSS
jgi:hypothetical protein